jgi:hypothetical protein
MEIRLGLPYADTVARVREALAPVADEAGARLARDRDSLARGQVLAPRSLQDEEALS